MPTAKNFPDIHYEPDGNIPPDFGLNADIGVEVRRLNENVFSGTKGEGLELLTGNYS